MRRLGFVLILIAGCGNHSGPVTQQLGAAACITAHACGLGLLGDVSECSEMISYVNDSQYAVTFRLTPSQVGCIAAAGADCAAAKRCLAGGRTPAACPTVGESCSGDSWQSCTSVAGSGGKFGVRTFDCAAYGQRCIAIGTTADCGFGGCMSGETPATCVTADGSPGGNFAETCLGYGTLHRRDCVLLDASCNSSGALGGHCRGNGPTCAAAPLGSDDTLGCDGTVLLHCLDGQQAREDCSRYGLGCFARLTGGGYGCFAGDECDPFNPAASCAGKSLSFCNNGKMQTFDCGAAGFATCDASNGGSCGM